jgi:hypothetical protein
MNQISLTQSILIGYLLSTLHGGVRSGISNADIIGKWEFKTKYPNLDAQSGQDLHSSAGSRNQHDLSASGYRKMIFTLRLLSDHRFSWEPVIVKGRWSLKGNSVALAADSATPMDWANDYSTTSTNGRPDFDLVYSAKDRTLSWHSGIKKNHTQSWQVYIRRASH